MNLLNFIETKRDGKENNHEQIQEFVKLVTKGEIPDYQIAAWLMAVFFKGMSEDENRVFTNAIAESGNKVTFPPDLFPVDKHSTGGVGDKTTLVVVPLAAACGLPVAKLSGRGLGFTGGTIDKLESIPGFVSRLDLKQFIRQVEDIGCAVSGHSGDLAPAEASFYELRDVTGTVPCIPLITSSIVSKKLAGGSKAFVFDVKCGSGAFMKDLESGKALAVNLVRLSSSLGRAAMALLTDMSQPLGRWVGNSAEVMEAVEVLKGRGPDDTRALCIRIAATMLLMGGKISKMSEAESVTRESLDSGGAFAMFEKLVQAQEGRLDEFMSAVNKGDHIAPCILNISASESGWVHRCEARGIGDAVRLLGGGRFYREQDIDKKVGCEILAKRGVKVEKGDILARLYCREKDERSENAVNLVREAFSLGEKIESNDIVLGAEGPVYPY